MTTMGEGNPVELFNMHVAHVGINAKDPDEAQRIAKQFELLLGLTPRETPISFFSDTLVETMKQNGRGEHGHIGLAVNDTAAAEAWLRERGVEFIEESRVHNEDGSTFLIYLKDQIGGFAIHLSQGK